MFRYRRNVFSCECPVIFMTSVWGEPDETILVVAVCRQSWNLKSFIFASSQADLNAVLIVFVMPKTVESRFFDEAFHSVSSSSFNLWVIPTLLASSVFVFVWGMYISLEEKSMSFHRILKISPLRIAVSRAHISKGLKWAFLPTQTSRSLVSSSNDKTRSRSASAAFEIIPLIKAKGFLISHSFWTA